MLFEKDATKYREKIIEVAQAAYDKSAHCPQLRQELFSMARDLKIPEYQILQDLRDAPIKSTGSNW